MASIIRIKRSSVSGNPGTLAAGELAYSGLADNGSNGGDRLYIGIGAENAGNAANHYIIGGKYFTDMMDHTRGTLTASSAIIVDADKKIDNLLVDNLELNGNTIYSIGNMVLSPNESNYIQLSGGAKIASSPNDGSQLDLGGGNASLVQYRGGDVSLSVGSGGTASYTAKLNNADGSFTIPGIIKTTVTNADINLNPNGTGKVKIADTWTLPRSAGTNGYALITNGSDTASWTQISTSLGISGDTGTDTVSLVSDTLAFTGGTGIDTAITNNTVTISVESSVVKSITTDTGALTPSSNAFSILGGEGINVTHAGSTITVDGELASTSNVGSASFSSNSFAVSAAGEVTIKSAGVSNSQLANSSVTFGTTQVSLGSSSTSIGGVSELDVDNLNFNGNTISSTNSNGDIVLSPNGTGKIDVSDSLITGLKEPVQPSDAATKGYVDSVAQGLHVHEPVKATTTNTLANITGGTVTYNNTNGTITLSVPLTVLDGYTLQDGNRILVKDETVLARNGIYTWSTGGVLLTRSDRENTAAELSGGDFVFVVNGTSYGDTGWVQTNEVAVFGDPIVWQQFSGAGAFTAGEGLALTGTTFDVLVATDGGIEISADRLQLKSTLAGNGLTYSNGVLAVGGTSDRITVTSDNIDIASTYAGQSSIVTLGTVTTGTWSATTIATTKGGTGLTSYVKGDLLYASAVDTLAKLAIGETEGLVLQVNASGLPVWAGIDGGTY